MCKVSQLYDLFSLERWYFSMLSMARALVRFVAVNMATFAEMMKNMSDGSDASMKNSEGGWERS